MSMSRFAKWTGFMFTALTTVGLVLNTSALPVVLDIRPGILVLASAAVPLLILSFRTGRSAAFRAAAAGAIFLTGSAALLMIWDLAFAYRTEDVSFRNGSLTFHGTLYTPRGTAPYPAVLLIHGSGRQTRDEHRFWARAYARRGIAALAYDKRGSGESEGDVATASYEQLAADAVAAIEMLRSREDVVDERVGISATSEGEWVGPIAARAARAAFLVLVSPSAMTPSEQVGYEAGANVLRAGFSAEAARRARDLYARIASFQRTGKGRAELNRDLRQASSEPWFEAARYLETSVPEYEKVLALDWFPAWRARMDFDALPLISRLECPVLAQVGGNDPKNDGAAALNRIRSALAEEGNTAFTGRLYPDAGHALIHWPLPFGLPPPWFAPGYVDTQLDWVEQQVRTP